MVTEVAPPMAPETKHTASEGCGVRATERSPGRKATVSTQFRLALATSIKQSPCGRDAQFTFSGPHVSPEVTLPSLAHLVLSASAPRTLHTDTPP